jgi:hypothetical protein
MDRKGIVQASRRPCINITERLKRQGSTLSFRCADVEALGHIVFSMNGWRYSKGSNALSG